MVVTRLIAGEGRVLILCPASLRINWERKIHAVYPQAVVGIVGEDRHATLYGCDWVIANYERLGDLVRDPELVFEVMAINEAHYLKESKSTRPGARATPSCWQPAFPGATSSPAPRCSTGRSSCSPCCA